MIDQKRCEQCHHAMGGDVCQVCGGRAETVARAIARRGDVSHFATNVHTPSELGDAMRGNH